MPIKTKAYLDKINKITKTLDAKGALLTFTRTTFCALDVNLIAKTHLFLLRQAWQTWQSELN